MTTWLSEDLNERETVSTGAVRLHGWSLTNTGTQARFVAFKDEEITKPMIVVPAGEERSFSGLDQPFPRGLAIESLEGDGKLVANVFFSERSDAPPETEEDEPPDEDEPLEEVA